MESSNRQQGNNQPNNINSNRSSIFQIISSDLNRNRSRSTTNSEVLLDNDNENNNNDNANSLNAAATDATTIHRNNHQIGTAAVSQQSDLRNDNAEDANNHNNDNGSNNSETYRMQNSNNTSREVVFSSSNNNNNNIPPSSSSPPNSERYSVRVGDTEPSTRSSGGTRSQTSPSSSSASSTGSNSTQSGPSVSSLQSQQHSADFRFRRQQALWQSLPMGRTAPHLFRQTAESRNQTAGGLVVIERDYESLWPLPEPGLLLNAHARARLNRPRAEPNSTAQGIAEVEAYIAEARAQLEDSAQRFRPRASPPATATGEADGGAQAAARQSPVARLSVRVHAPSPEELQLMFLGDYLLNENENAEQPDADSDNELNPAHPESFVGRIRRDIAAETGGSLSQEQQAAVDRVLQRAFYRKPANTGDTAFADFLRNSGCSTENLVSKKRDYEQMMDRLRNHRYDLNDDDDGDDNDQMNPPHQQKKNKPNSNKRLRTEENSSGASTSNGSSNQCENRSFRCFICWEKPETDPDINFKCPPCGHIICTVCFARYRNARKVKCHYCKQAFKQVNACKVFLN